MSTRSKNRTLLLLIMLALFGGAACPAESACSMQITAAFPCDCRGNPHIPKVGDAYFIRVNWTVTGTPDAPYAIEFTEANKSFRVTGLPAESGRFNWRYGANLPLDCEIPCAVTLDPANVSGAPVRGRTAVFHFTPEPPASALQYFGTRVYAASESMSVHWADSGGRISRGLIWLGAPTSESYQRVLSAEAPAQSVRLRTEPSGDPVWETDYRDFNPAPGNDVWVSGDRFTVALSSVRVNTHALRQVSWRDLQSTSLTMRPWLIPDGAVHSDSPAIAAFVESVLPRNYRSTMSPYDAAKSLFLAVVRCTAYVYPPPSEDSVEILQSHCTDCGGFSTLYNACLRRVGIPSRCLCGFLPGHSAWHCILEFYLPRCGWIPADGAACRSWDPTGAYAYDFGSYPDLNKLCCVSRGWSHNTSAMHAGNVQAGAFWVWYSGRGPASTQSHESDLRVIGLGSAAR